MQELRAVAALRVPLQQRLQAQATTGRRALHVKVAVAAVLEAQPLVLAVLVETAARPLVVEAVAAHL